MNYNLAEITSTIQKNIQEILDIEARNRANIQAMFEPMVKEFFAANPNVIGISWRQYTPYFNDGDECVFSVNDKVAVLKTDYCSDIETYLDDDDRYEDYGENLLYYNPYFHKIQADIQNEKDELNQPERWKGHHDYCRVKLQKYIEYLNYPDIESINKNVQEFMKLLDTISDDIYKKMFGDHVSVSLTANGIHIEEYDHE